MRIWALRAVALAVLLLLALLAVLGTRTLSRLPDTVVYFVRSGDASFTLERVYRKTVRGEPEAHARASLQALIEGPTAAERKLGLTSAFPADLRIRSVEVRDGIVAVDLAPAFERGGGSALMQARLAQLFYTLTQPSRIRGVALSIDGAPVRVYSGEGLMVDQPWLRAAHPDLPAW